MHLDSQHPCPKCGTYLMVVAKHAPVPVGLATLRACGNLSCPVVQAPLNYLVSATGELTEVPVALVESLLAEQKRLAQEAVRAWHKQVSRSQPHVASWLWRLLRRSAG